jgi:hypothetical protein
MTNVVREVRIDVENACGDQPYALHIYLNKEVHRVSQCHMPWSMAGLSRSVPLVGRAQRQIVNGALNAGEHVFGTGIRPKAVSLRGPPPFHPATDLTEKE